jgi:hypothetical protein
MWRVRIRANGKEINLGAFRTRAEAKASYATGALLLHGSFARTVGRRARTHRRFAKLRRRVHSGAANSVYSLSQGERE